jgi:hypothetical protein
VYKIIDEQGNTIAITSRLEDAKALVNNNLDGIEYKIKVDKPKK